MEHVKEMPGSSLSKYELQVKIILNNLSESDEQLAERRRNFDRYKREAEQKLAREERRLQDALEDLETARASLMSLQQERGGLEAEKKVHII